MDANSSTGPSVGYLKISNTISRFPVGFPIFGIPTRIHIIGIGDSQYIALEQFSIYFLDLAGRLQAGRDMLGNVSVLGQPTPTARFMGGREFSALLDGAPADLGTEQDLHHLLQTQTFAIPSLSLIHI